MKGLSPQNTFGVSGVNRVAAKSNTIEVDGDHFYKRETQHTAPVVSPIIFILLDSIMKGQVTLIDPTYDLGFRPSFSCGLKH